MVILIDTNIIVDFLQKRPLFFEAAERILKLCAQRKVEGYIAFHCLPTIWYLMKGLDDKTKRDKLHDICQITEVCSAPHEAVADALIKADFKDFEDCLQDKCAVEVGAEYIITRNIIDFSRSETPAITPDEFLRIWDELHKSSLPRHLINAPKE